MGTIIVALAAALALVLWAVSCRRRLAVMSENASSAMAQIGVQVSSRFDALLELLDLTKEYAAQESQTLIETLGSRRNVITGASSVEDVLKQESLASEALNRISTLAERYPELKADANYARCMSAVDSCEKMMYISRLIYNDSVTKLNRELRMFPTSLLAGIFGFRQRDYLEAVENEADVSVVE